jgi:HK97 family phage portal protein
LAPEDSQFLESRAFSVNDVARWFNLPPHKLKDLTRSSFSNIEQEQISFVVDSILPWLIRVEQIYNLQLLNDLEKLQGFYTRHNVDGIMRGNSNDRSTYYSKMFAIGAISINEIRATEGWNAFDNPYCDEPFIPVNNMVPISKIDEFLNRQVNPNSDRESSPESYNNGGTNDEK